MSCHLPQPKQTLRLPTDSAATPSPPKPTILSPSAYFSNDHYAGTSSISTDGHASRSTTIKQTSFAADSSGSVVPTSHSIDSLAGLQLYIDLSSYPL